MVFCTCSNNNGKVFLSHFGKNSSFFFHFFEASDREKKMTPVNTFVCANRYLRAWVLVCMYVRTCVSVKADLYVQL